MRLRTLLANFRKFILTVKYKGFCNAIIRGLQFQIAVALRGDQVSRAGHDRTA
jgi:hypothetical protein